MSTRAPATRADQKAATRERLLRVARQAFTAHGYADTSVGRICRAARVTHGALYHHFPSKIDLFVAVLEQVTAEVADRVRAATDHASGWSQIDAACDAYLDACMEPSVQAILLRDGPRVLPPAAFGAIDHGTNEPLVVRLLRDWIEAGLLRPLSVHVVAPVLGGAFAEAGAAIASAEDPAAVRRELGEIFRAWTHALAAPDRAQPEKRGSRATAPDSERT